MSSLWSLIWSGCSKSVCVAGNFITAIVNNCCSNWALNQLNSLYRTAYCLQILAYFIINSHLFLGLSCSDFSRACPITFRGSQSSQMVFYSLAVCEIVQDSHLPNQFPYFSAHTSPNLLFSHPVNTPSSSALFLIHSLPF